MAQPSLTSHNLYLGPYTAAEDDPYQLGRAGLVRISQVSRSFLFPDCHSIFGHGENRNEADYVCGNELINKQCVYLSTYAYMHWILLLVSVMGKRMKNLNSECAMIDVHESKFCHIRSAPNIYKIFLVYQNKIGII